MLRGFHPAYDSATCRTLNDASSRSAGLKPAKIDATVRSNAEKDSRNCTLMASETVSFARASCVSVSALCSRPRNSDASLALNLFKSGMTSKIGESINYCQHLFVRAPRCHFKPANGSATCVTPSVRFGGRLASRRWRSAPSGWRLASTPGCSASSTGCCCGHCRTAAQIG